MFTGIIQRQGKIIETRPSGPSMAICLDSGFGDLELGESVAVNGVCLTVTESDRAGQAIFFVSPETLSRTNLGTMTAGSRVNLERALRAGDRLSGHLVQGHVDGQATFLGATPGTESPPSYQARFQIPPSLSRYCVEKGSIALDGISLTINQLDPQNGTIGITLIPHTWNHTRLNELKPGDAVNLEVDVLGKYVERLCQPYLKR